MALEHLSDVVQRCVSTSGDMEFNRLTVIPVLNVMLLISCLILIFWFNNRNYLITYFLHTQQTLPVESYNSEDYDVFTVSGRTCIEEGNSAQVLSIVLDEKNQVQHRLSAL